MKKIIISLAIIGSLLFTAATYGEDAPVKKKITEGEFAVKVVKMLKMQDQLPVAPLEEDYIKALEQYGISPLMGWDAKRMLTYENYVVVLAMASGLEDTVHEEAQRACDTIAERISSQWQAKYNAEGRWASLEELINDKDYFKDGPSHCPYRTKYRVKKGTHEIIRHDHIGRMLLKQAKPVSEQKPVEESANDASKSTGQADTQQAEKAKPKSCDLSALKDILSISVGLKQEHDDNVFLEQTGTHWDWKTVLTPSISLRKDFDKAYASLGYDMEATDFGGFAAWVLSQKANAKATYDINQNWTVGARDIYINEGQKWVPSGGSDDRILRLGYNINSMTAGNKTKIMDNLNFIADYQFDYMNFTDKNIHAFIDRNSNEIRTALEYVFTPNVSGEVGYACRLLEYPSDAAANKNFSSNKIQCEVVYKFTRLFTADLGLEGEWRNFYKGGDRSSFNIKAGLTSTFSRFTFVGLRYIHNLGDSSRETFKQYGSDKLGAALSHYFNPTTAMSLNMDIEQQFYDDEDRLVNTISSGDRKNYIYSGGISLRKNLTNWLSANIGYSYARRESDFAAESSTNNLYNITLRALW